MEEIIFSNEYGSVTLTPVTEYVPVSKISAARYPVVNDHLLTMEDGEQLALITNNQGIQITLPYISNPSHPQRTSCYVIHHQTARIACVCKVEFHESKIDSGLTAEKEIQRLYEQSPEKFGLGM